MASHVEMLSGRRKKDYASEAAADALMAQAAVMGIDPQGSEFDESEADPDAEEPELEEHVIVAA